jgi:hypothetical protein
MKNNKFIKSFIALLFFTTLYTLVNAQNKAVIGSKDMLNDKEALSVFAANGDSMIIRPEHLGIVNGMATVGITHNYVGQVDGLWAQPLVSSSFHILPRLWGEKVKTEHYTWLPFQTKSVGYLKGVEFRSVTTLIFGMRAGIEELTFRNTTKQKMIIPLQLVLNDQYNYKISLDYVQNWGFSTPQSKTAVEDEYYGKGLLRVQGKYAIGVAIKDATWEALTRRFHTAITLNPGEERKTFLVFSIEEKAKATQLRDDLLENPEKYIKESTEKYISEVRNVFEKLPRLISNNQNLVRFLIVP